MIDFSGYPPLLGVDADDDATTAVCDAIRGYCRWHIAPLAVDDVMVVDNSFGRRVLALPTRRVTAVGSVVDRDGADIEDFEWSQSGVLERAVGWPTGLRAVTVTLTHGFEEVPPAIRAVVQDMLRDYENAAAGGTVASVKLDDADVELSNPYAPRGTSSDVAARRSIGAAYGHILDRYRL